MIGSKEERQKNNTRSTTLSHYHTTTLLQYSMSTLIYYDTTTLTRVYRQRIICLYVFVADTAAGISLIQFRFAIKDALAGRGTLTLETSCNGLRYR